MITAEDIKDVPILVLGNKIDQPTAVREEDIRQFFGIPSTTFSHGTRPIELMMCSLVRKQGYGEGTLLGSHLNALNSSQSYCRVLIIVSRLGFIWLSKQISDRDKREEQ